MRTIPDDCLNTVNLRQGTPMFMASALLAAADRGQPISRTYMHDAESLAWVVIFVIYQRARVDERQGFDEVPLVRYRPKLKEEYKELFSTGACISDLGSERQIALLLHISVISSLLDYANRSAPCDKMSAEIWVGIVESTHSFLSACAALQEVFSYQSRGILPDDSSCRGHSTRAELYALKTQCEENMLSLARESVEIKWKLWIYELNRAAHFSRDGTSSDALENEWKRVHDKIDLTIPSGAM